MQRSKVLNFIFGDHKVKILILGEDTIQFFDWLVRSFFAGHSNSASDLNEQEVVNEKKLQKTKRIFFVF